MKIQKIFKLIKTLKYKMLRLNLTQHMSRTLEEFLACLGMDRAALGVCETNRLEMHEVTAWKNRLQVILKDRVGQTLVEETCK